MSDETKRYDNEVVSMMESILNSWKSYIEDCYESGEPPQISYEDYIALKLKEYKSKEQEEVTWSLFRHTSGLGVCPVCHKQDRVDILLQKYCRYCGTKISVPD